MKSMKRSLALAVMTAAITSVGCSGGDYIPLAKVEDSKEQPSSGPAPKKPGGVAGSPTTPVYK